MEQVISLKPYLIEPKSNIFDIFPYFAGLILFILPFTKFRLHFAFFTIGYFLLVGCLLLLIKWLPDVLSVKIKVSMKDKSLSKNINREVCLKSNFYIYLEKKIYALKTLFLNIRNYFLADLSLSYETELSRIMPP